MAQGEESWNLSVWLLLGLAWLASPSSLEELDCFLKYTFHIALFSQKGFSCILK